MSSRVLFLTCMPLSQPKSASMAFMDVLLRKYPNKFTWFSLREPVVPSWNPYNIPYSNCPHVRKPARFPVLRRLLNYHFHSRVQAFQAARFGRENNCEVVLADLSFEAVVVGRLTAKYLGVPLLVNVHDDPINRIRLKGYPDWFIRWYAKQFERTLITAKKVGVISDYMGEAYQQCYGVDTTTLYIGVNNDDCLAPTPLNHTKNPLIIGSIGSMNSWENWQLLIEAVRLLNENIGVQRFHILHIGKLDDKFSKFPEVEVTGWIPKSDFLKHLFRIDVGFLSMSFSTDSRETSRLSFPLKIHSFIEAQKPMMALGPKFSSVVRFVNDYQLGEVCTVQNRKNLAESLKALIFCEEKYNNALNGVIKLKHEFSREKFFMNFEGFINYK